MKLERDRWREVMSLFDAVPQDRPDIQARLSDLSSTIFVEGDDSATMALLVPKPGVVGLLAGSPNAEGLRQVWQEGKGMITELALPDQTWVQVFGEAFGFEFCRRPRVTFAWKPQSLDLATAPGATAAQVERIDRKWIDAVCAIEPDFWDSYADGESFLRQGFGFCAIEHGAAVSACWSTFPPVDSLLDISVATRREWRKRGLALAVCNALLRECVERQITPFWTTDGWNVASQRLAGKLGFVEAQRHFWMSHTPWNAGKKRVAVDAKMLAEYVGRYGDAGKVIKIVQDGAALVFHDDLGQKLEMVAETATRFFLTQVPIEIEFGRGASGFVSGFLRRQGGKEWWMGKLDDAPRPA